VTAAAMIGRHSASIIAPAATVEPLTKTFFCSGLTDLIEA
jgi:hypothetical protein